MSTENYKLLYEISKKAMEDEIERIKKLDEKASKLLTVVGIVIVAFTALIKEAADFNFECHLYVKILFWFMAGLSYLVLIYSWGVLLAVFKLMDVAKLPLNNETFDFFENESLITCYWALAKKCKESVDLNSENIGFKIRKLNLAYENIQFSAWCVSITLIIIFLTKIFGV